MDNPYLLLTPGPLSTSPSVRSAMMRDWCTWDRDYNVGVVQHVRQKLVKLASSDPTTQEQYSAVLMQGSGTFCVESLIGSTIAAQDKLLVLANGAYGQRIARMARVLKIDHLVQDSGEQRRPDLNQLDETLAQDGGITHVAMVHCETTTGMLNSLEDVGQVVNRHGRRFLVDAMSTFGGVPLDVGQLGIDALVSSANKCIQGVPGFGFVIGRREYLQAAKGLARSLSLDLHDQWATMEANDGKWRFTSPTHTVRAFAQALSELNDEGGIAKRHARYEANQALLVRGMRNLGFSCFLPATYHSPIITAFHDPDDPAYCFQSFYDSLKQQGFVIYPGKVTDVDTFRIGTIGEVHAENVHQLLDAVKASMYWNR